MTNNHTTTTHGIAKNGGPKKGRGRSAKAMLVLAALVSTGGAVLPLGSPAHAAEPAVVATANDDALTIEEMEALNAELEAIAARLGSNDRLEVASTSWQMTMAKKLGKKLGEHVFDKAVDYGLNELFDALGLTDGTAQAMEDIMASIDKVQESVEANTELLKGLSEDLKWQTFDEKENDVQVAKVLITNTSENIGRFEAGGLEVTEADVTTMWNGTTEGMATIKARITGLSGTMTFLQNAAVSQPHDDAWNTLEEYRDHYRALLAQGVVNLTWLMQYDELEPRTLEVYYQTAISNAEATLNAMYDSVGVAYGDPLEFGESPSTVGSSLYLTRTQPGTVFASDDRPKLPGEDTTMVNYGSAARAMYQELKAEFESGTKNGQTFEQYLKSQNFPTKVVHANTIDWGVVPDGQYYADVYWNETRVEGDSVTDYKLRNWDAYRSSHSSRSEAEKVAKQKRDELWEQAEYHSPYRFKASTNGAGLAVSADEHAVELARTGFHVEVGDSKWGNDIGALSFENAGGYDTVYFLDAESGEYLGEADISGDTPRNNKFTAPQSGEVQIVIGNDVAGHDQVMVPVAFTTVEVGDATPNKDGHVQFSRITVVDSQS